MSRFVHLHAHTVYSPFDGMLDLNELFPKARFHGSKAMAITDHGVLCGAASFYKAATRVGIKPIIGCELSLVPLGISCEPSAKPHLHLTHLTVLCKDEAGYRNLCRLTNSSHLLGSIFPPSVYEEVLLNNCQGLIVLSGCGRGAIPEAIRGGNYQRAREIAEMYKGILGKDNFFLELIDHGLPWQKDLNRRLLELGGVLSIPVVASNNCHYLEPYDASTHEVLNHIKNETQFGDPGELSHRNRERYLKSPSEMVELFSWCPEAVENSVRIADACNFELDFKTYHFPQCECPEAETPASYLKRLAHEGLRSRLTEGSIPAEALDAYSARLDDELRTVIAFCFEGYWLIVNEIVDYARNAGIPMGPGKGAASASLVNFALHITQVDPVATGLQFESFLSADEVAIPSFGLETTPAGREGIINFLRNRYGQDMVAEIITFEKLPGEEVINKVAAAIKLDGSRLKAVADIMGRYPGFGIDEIHATEQELSKLMLADPSGVGQLITQSMRLDGVLLYNAKNPSRIILSHKPVGDHGPVFKGQSGELLAQYPLKDCAALGLLCLDIQGRQILEDLHGACSALETKRSVPLEWRPETLMPNESGVFAYLNNVFTKISHGVSIDSFEEEFGLHGLRQLILEGKPANIDELSVLIALSNSKALVSGTSEEYLSRKSAKKPSTYAFPELIPILEETCGIAVFKEQLEQILNLFSGYARNELKLLRERFQRSVKGESTQDLDAALRLLRGSGLDRPRAEALTKLISESSHVVASKPHAVARALLLYQITCVCREAHHYSRQKLVELLESLGNETGATVAALVLFGPDGGLHVKELYTQQPDLNIREEAGLSLESALLEQILVGKIAATDPAKAYCSSHLGYYELPFDIRGFLAVALESQGDCIGFLTVDSHQSGLFSVHTRMILEEFAGKMTAALFDLDKYEKLVRHPGKETLGAKDG